LGFDFESVLSLCYQINTENRVNPYDPSKRINSFYVNLFQNPAISKPVDDKLALPLAGTEKIIDHKGTLLAAFAIPEKDLSLLLSKQTDGLLNLTSLSNIFNYIVLSFGLKISLPNLVMLQDVVGIPDIFLNLQGIIDFVDLFNWVKNSALTIPELDYILNYNPDSPFGLRDEVIAQFILSLRESIFSNLEGNKDKQIISQIANSFSITPEQSRLILNNLNLGGQKVISIFSQENKLVERDANNLEFNTSINKVNFPKLFDAYHLLHKVSLLLKKHNIDQKSELEWILTKSIAFQFLDFSNLPISNTGVLNSLFKNWLNLHKWLYFKSQFPQPENVSLQQIFDLALNPATTKDDIISNISELTRWKVSDLNSLHTGIGLRVGHGPISDYANVDTYFRLLRCFDVLKRIGVEIDLLIFWCQRDSDANQEQFTISKQISQAIKSKYDYATWLSKITPIHDKIRERKRNALTSYLIEISSRKEQEQIEFNGNKFSNIKYWSNTNDLLNYFLIDVEMSSCQPTSRIKQAISSIQMFVQRCFLNLEQPFVEVGQEASENGVSLNSWKQWKWMKNYRIWEANRKVFLYPENWIEPELRDDKSPFFVELENEIMQNEINAENVESAFLHYLQKVHEVSRLDIVGVYHEIDDDSPYDNLPPNVNVLHVVGRTKTLPSVHYYRQYDLNYKTWTAWEKIDLDIVGDHVIPVVYNRKLHLFWLIFTEKAQKVKKQPPLKATDAPTSPPNATQPPKMLEIQLAWSVRKDKGWIAKKISTHKLVHPWERPVSSYNFKPRYKSRENYLWLDIYISTSVAFNNAKFYDPYTNNQIALTNQRYDENARAWHSSSFVFDGDVIDIKLKPLNGQYHFISLGSNGDIIEELKSSTSFDYIHNNFENDGRYINRLMENMKLLLDYCIQMV